jgi:hypothetical protein
MCLKKRISTEPFDVISSPLTPFARDRLALCIQYGSKNISPDEDFNRAKLIYHYVESELWKQHI